MKLKDLLTEQKVYEDGAMKHIVQDIKNGNAFEGDSGLILHVLGKVEDHLMTTSVDIDVANVKMKSFIKKTIDALEKYGSEEWKYILKEEIEDSKFKKYLK